LELGSNAVAHATRIVRANAGVDVVTDAIRIRIRRAAAATHSERIELVAVAVAIP
jgi:hypothetical protein